MYSNKLYIFICFLFDNTSFADSSWLLKIDPETKSPQHEIFHILWFAVMHLCWIQLSSHLENSTSTQCPRGRLKFESRHHRGTVDQASVRDPRCITPILLLEWVDSHQEVWVYRALLSGCGRDSSQFTKTHFLTCPRSHPVVHSYICQPPLQFSGTMWPRSDQWKEGRSNVWLF